MGCVQSCFNRFGLNTQDLDTGLQSSSQPIKEYSWDKKRETIDMSNFTIQNVKNQEVVRLPGSINGKLCAKIKISFQKLQFSFSYHEIQFYASLVSLFKSFYIEVKQKIN